MPPGGNTPIQGSVVSTSSRLGQSARSSPARALLFSGVVVLSAGCGAGGPPDGRPGGGPMGDSAGGADAPGAPEGGDFPEFALIAQESGTRALLQAISPVSEATVWVSGHEGTYARTLDGGETWSASVMSGEEALQFRDVEAVDASTAFLMSAGPGDLSRIYRTDDGGGTWVQQYVADHPDAFLDCLAFWDRDRGLAYGDAVEGVLFLLRTEDGGNTWERLPGEALPPALEGEGGFAASGTCLVTGGEGRAWIATGNGYRARVLRTVDWGRSWEGADVPVVGGSGAGLTTIRMDANGRRGLSLGGIIGQDSARTVNVAVTRDGGASWVPGGPRARPGPAYGSALVGVPQPEALEGADGTTASGSDHPRAAPIAVAVGPRGMDWSADLGRTWVTLDTLAWWAVAFASENDGWAVGPEGRILKLSLR